MSENALRRTPQGSIDPAEIARFDRLAERWWDPDGEMRPLHRMNPTRLAWLRDTLIAELTPAGSPGRPLAGLSVLDVGCGGGLLCEPLTRIGARVTGIDPGETSIAVARRHAEAGGLEIDYRVSNIESLVSKGVSFDVVCAMEVVEHVTEPVSFVRSCAACVKPGGLLVMSTLNRTAKSFALAIVGAEYVLRWLPAGTHDWKKFVTPQELGEAMQEAGCMPVATGGIVYDPFRDRWVNSSDTSVNYMTAARRES